MDDRRLISANAQSLRDLHARVHEAWRAGRGTPSHVAACEEFRARYDRLAFPGGLAAALDRLRRADPATVETAIRFLEEDPQFFRSGYIKEEIVRRLKRAPLTRPQLDRLPPVMLRSLTAGPRRVFRELAKLAPMMPPPALLPALNRHVTSADPEARRRALHILHVLRSRQRIS